MSDIFELATRKKFRFQTNKGSLSVEQMWDLNKSELNAVYVSVANQLIQETENESLLDTRSVSVNNLEVKKQIIKRIFDWKVYMAEKADARKLAKAQRDRILEALREKEDGAIMSKSQKELVKELEKLEEVLNEEE